MSKALKKIIGIAAGVTAAWGVAIKPRVLHKPDLAVFRRYDFAHRGFYNPAKQIPENSAPAFRAAVEHGYGVTLDVRLSRDGVPVVFRDSRLYRLCGADGTVENSTLEELQELSLSDTEEKIPTLEEALEVIDCQVPVLLNLHIADGAYASLCEKTCEILDAYEGIFALSSIDPRVLHWFRIQRDEYIRGQIVDYSHKSGIRIQDRIWDFICSSLLGNFLSAPDFISVNIDDRKTASLLFCRMLYHVQTLDWTVKTLEDYELVKTDGSVAVFEDIEP